MSEVEITHLTRDLETLRQRIKRSGEILHPFSSCENTPDTPPVTRAINDALTMLDSGMTCAEYEVES
jgi:hypothetical protein